MQNAGRGALVTRELWYHPVFSRGKVGLRTRLAWRTEAGSGPEQPDCRARSGGRQATVDEDHLAGDVVAGAAGQEDRDSLEILWLAVAADHGAGRQRGGADRVGRDLGGERGGHEAGHDRVAAHAVWGPGLGLGPGQSREAGLGRAVAAAVAEGPDRLL